MYWFTFTSINSISTIWNINSSHQYLHFKCNTTNFILVFFLFPFVTFLHNVEKLGSHYSNIFYFISLFFNVSNLSVICCYIQSAFPHHSPACVLNCSVISGFVTLWTVAHQAPLSVEFSGQSIEFSRQLSKNTGLDCHFLFQVTHNGLWYAVQSHRCHWVLF